MQEEDVRVLADVLRVFVQQAEGFGRTADAEHRINGIAQTVEVLLRIGLVGECLPG